MTIGNSYLHNVGYFNFSAAPVAVNSSGVIHQYTDMTPFKRKDIVLKSLQINLRTLIAENPLAMPVVGVMLASQPLGDGNVLPLWTTTDNLSTGGIFYFDVINSLPSKCKDVVFEKDSLILNAGDKIYMSVVVDNYDTVNAFSSAIRAHFTFGYQPLDIYTRQEDEKWANRFATAFSRL